MRADGGGQLNSVLAADLYLNQPTFASTIQIEMVGVFQSLSARCASKLAALYIILSAVATPAAVKGSKKVRWAGNGHAYQAVYAKYTWLAARNFCARMGGHLATITSEEENRFVFTSVGRKGMTFWLGGTDEKKEGRWTWITGEEWAYSAWNRGAPNDWKGQDYLAYNDSSPGRWDDKGLPRENELHAFICEWEPEKPRRVTHKPKPKPPLPTPRPPAVARTVKRPTPRPLLPAQSVRILPAPGGPSRQVAACREQVAKNPTSLDALCALAEAYAAQAVSLGPKKGKIAAIRALQYAGKAREIDPNSVKAFIATAIAYRARGSADRTRKWIEKARKLDPNHPRVLEFMAEFH
jgi:tetratricopeptide (TPR) repeat protein